MRLTYRNVSKTEDLCNFTLHHATCLHLISSNDKCLVSGMITSLHSRYMTSGYHHDRQITSWGERAYQGKTCSKYLIYIIASCKISIYQLVSVAEQAGLILIWSQTLYIIILQNPNQNSFCHFNFYQTCINHGHYIAR